MDPTVSSSDDVVTSHGLDDTELSAAMAEGMLEPPRTGSPASDVSDDLQFVDDLNIDAEAEDLTSEPVVPSPSNKRSETETKASPSGKQPRISINRLQADILNLTNQKTELKIPSSNLNSKPMEIDDQVETHMKETETINRAGKSLSEVTQSTSYKTCPEEPMETEEPSGTIPTVKVEEVDTMDQDTAPSSPIELKPTTEILKHIIDGFTIEEGPDAFPLHRSSLLTELLPKKKITRRRGLTSTPRSLKQSRNNTPSATRSATPVQVLHEPADDPIQSRSANTNPNTIIYSGYEDLTCSYCGNSCGEELCFYRNNPYCTRKCSFQVKKQVYKEMKKNKTLKPKRGRPVGSLTRNKPTARNSGLLAKTFNSVYRRKQSCTPTPPQSESKMDCHSSPTGYHPSRVPLYPPDRTDYRRPGSAPSYSKQDVVHWTVLEVARFVGSIDGCIDYALDFEHQEIDGRALLLLTEDLLVNALDIRINSALDICSHISAFT